LIGIREGMVERVDCAVIGAGVVGLAVARELALAGREVIVLEKADAIGTETSSRNSEVIHAGIYYAPGSLKARLCVEGKQLLYRYCVERGIAHARLGKLLVATSPAEIPTLETYARTAAANGVGDLAWLRPGEVAALEPAVRCVAAVHSPSTGIVDSHGLMQALEGDAANAGAQVVFRSGVERGAAGRAGIDLEVGGAERMAIRCRSVVNCAGLAAPAVARAIAGMPQGRVPREYYAKGHYYTLAGRSPFRRLVYPMAEAGGLGVHVTLDLAGQARFGPDVEWVTAVDYAFDSSGAARFYAAIRRYYPGLADGALQPGYTGVRPKIAGPGEPAADFLIQGSEDHGIAGLVNLFGIESPGLTAALAIAREVLVRLPAR
jgi:L-2-hydroxyglutarate oxidase LhgO